MVFYEIDYITIALLLHEKRYVLIARAFLYDNTTLSD